VTHLFQYLTKIAHRQKCEIRQSLAFPTTNLRARLNEIGRWLSDREQWPVAGEWRPALSFFALWE